VNIILKSFDGPFDHVTIERAFRDIPLGTCISINWKLREIPTLKAEKHLCWDAQKFRWAQYQDIDWKSIQPLDEELIESMRHCEGIFMAMIARNSLDDIPYGERKKTYYQHLRYWNHIIATEKIDFLLLNHAPHQSYDWVIYELCRIKGINSLLVYRADPVGRAMMIENFEDASLEVRERFLALKQEYADISKEVTLSPKMEQYYQKQTTRDEKPWNMVEREKHLLQKSFVKKWWSIAMSMLIRKPRVFLSHVLSPNFWKRKLREHQTIRFYDQHTQEPDLAVPYIYVALHMQPEATTCPIGGAYVDQELLVQMIAYHLPPGVRIYVKEHPNQKEVMRSPSFYQSMLDLPCVTFVPRQTSTFALMKNALAIATVTGTAAFEGLFREKPALVFGHIHYQYASGVHRIRSAEDCRKALQEIIVEEKKPSLRDIRLYLKAIDECSSEYEDAPQWPTKTLSTEEQSILLGENIARAIMKVSAR
jgi:hypothetical protein